MKKIFLGAALLVSAMCFGTASTVNAKQQTQTVTAAKKVVKADSKGCCKDGKCADAKKCAKAAKVGKCAKKGDCCAKKDKCVKKDKGTDTKKAK